MSLLEQPLNLSEDEHSIIEKKDLANNLSMKENERFTKYGPIATLFIMSIGPFALVIQAVADLLDMKLITKRFNNDSNSHAVEVLGFSGQIISFTTFVGVYFGEMMIIRVTALLGEGRRNDASNLVSDVFRLSFMFSIVFTLALILGVKSLLTFVGTTDDLLDETYNYCFATLIAFPFTALFSIEPYFLQSIGLSIHSGALKVLSYILQVGIFSPILLFALKVPTTFMKYGSIISQAILGIVFFIIIFKGKFSLALNFKQLLGRFSKETPKALLYALPIIFAIVGMIFAQIFLMSTLTSSDIDHSHEIGGFFAIYGQMTVVCQVFPSSLLQGFMSAGNHAFGARNYKRFIQLMLWSTVIIFLSIIVLIFVIIIGNKQIVGFFIDESDGKFDYICKLLPIPFYTTPLTCFSLVAQSAAVIIGKPHLSVLPMLGSIISFCAGAKILSCFYKEADKIIQVFNLSNIFVAFLSIPLWIYAILYARKMMRNQDLIIKTADPMEISEISVGE